MLVALGVRADGQRVLLDLRLAGQATTAAWEERITTLGQRPLGVPRLAISDGNPGLQAVVRPSCGFWVQVEIRGCNRTPADQTEYLVRSLVG